MCLRRMLPGCGCRDPEDKQIQRELLQVKRTQREEQKASAHLFKGALGPPPKPKPAAAAGAPGPQQQVDAAAPAGAAAAGSAAAGAGAPWWQPLFALLAALLAWLRQAWRRQHRD